MNGPINCAQAGQEWIKMVLFGGSGVGKTVFCCSSQAMRTFVFDVDDGMFSAKTWPRTRKEMVDYWPVRSREEFQRAFEWLVVNQSRYQLVVVDTATELQRQVMREVCLRGKQETPRQQDWGVVLNVMEAIASSMRHLPMHVVWVAHEIEKEDPEKKRVMFRPSFQGAFGTSYAKHFSVVARYCLFDEPIAGEDGKPVVGQYRTYRALQCERDEFTHSKNRGGALQRWEAPDIDTVIGKMLAATQNGWVQGTPDPQLVGAPPALAAP